MKVVIPILHKVMATSIILILLTACSGDNSYKGIIFIRENLDNYNVEQEPWDKNVTYSLTKDEILNQDIQMDKIGEEHNTTIFLSEITSFKNSATNKMNLCVGFELEYDYQSPKGTMLSPWKLAEEGGYYQTTEMKLYSKDKQNDIPFQAEQGPAPNGKGYKQYFGFCLEKEKIKEYPGDEFTFEISNFYVLHYEEADIWAKYFK